MPLLQTTSLTIAPCRPEDSADFIALEADPEVMRFLTDGRTGALMLDRIDETYLRPRGTEPHVWTARRTSSGSFVGWFCLWPEDAGVAELGYRLRRAEWGQGLATEGAFALIEWGFNIAGHDKIIASTMAANQASRRVLEKCGLQHIRTVQVDWAEAIPGGGLGEVQYEQTRAAWISASHGP